MKSLKHKDIHTNFKHIYIITFLQSLCKDLKEKIAKKINSYKNINLHSY
jgi:hypothetical protein